MQPNVQHRLQLPFNDSSCRKVRADSGFRVSDTSTFRMEVIMEGNMLHEFFYKKPRIWAGTESFFKLSDFEYSEFLTSFLKVP